MNKAWSLTDIGDYGEFFVWADTSRCSALNSQLSSIENPLYCICLPVFVTVQSLSTELENLYEELWIVFYLIDNRSNSKCSLVPVSLMWGWFFSVLCHYKLIWIHFWTLGRTKQKNLKLSPWILGIFQYFLAFYRLIGKYICWSATTALNIVKGICCTHVCQVLHSY